MLNKVRDSIRKEMKYIPIFINNTKTLHYGVWNEMSLLNEYLLLLLNKSFMSEKRIQIIMDQFDSGIDGILDVVDEQMQVDLSIYYNAMITMMIEMVLEEELFESARNLDTFYNLFKKTIIYYE